MKRFYDRGDIYSEQNKHYLEGLKTKKVSRCSDSQWRSSQSKVCLDGLLRRGKERSFHAGRDATTDVKPAVGVSLIELVWCLKGKVPEQVDPT
jgi:hypothetical protein